jgi:Rieske 2Fe-2S family protein
LLNRTHQTLPASWYYDPDHYRRELESIWWKDWLCVARESEWAKTGSYRVIRVGNQQILITRSSSGELQAFHNTCRHRGALLCESAAGQFQQGRIVCPYHAWTYSLEGKLLRTPLKPDTADFRPESYSLYRVGLQTWGGFVFINLSGEPAADLLAAFGDEMAAVANWPLADLALAHREFHTVNCNWKIFWENYLECYHCPNVHHDLCRLVPVYGQGVSTDRDLPPNSRLHAAEGASPLAPGAVTWSADGTTQLPWFAGLSATEQSAGMTFCNLQPSAFIVAHVDYVRSVHVMPLGPEQTRLTVNWMLRPEALASGKVDIPSLTAVGHQVVTEDTRVCELNQKGLHSLRHEYGVRAPQEYDVLAFDDWVMDRLGQPRQS